MLRKRTRSSAQKDQQTGQITSDIDPNLQSNVLGQRQKTNAFFNVSGLFVGLSPMSTALECDSVRSPTSPLDFKLFSSLTTSFRFPKSSIEGCQKSWDSNKVGLGSIVDDGEYGQNLPKISIPLSNSKTILIGSQIRSKGPNSPTCVESLPKNYPGFGNTKLRCSNLQKSSSDVVFEIGGDSVETETTTDPFEKIRSFSLDSKRLGSKMSVLGARNVDLRTRNSRLQNESVLTDSGSVPNTGFGDGLVRVMSPEEIELSEDYTCVISRGPVPKTTHIFGDNVLECHPNGVDHGNKSEPFSYPSNGFLSCCDYCKKKLEDGKDIYMYRGEKAFCSNDCRLEEISIEEEHGKSINKPTKSENDDDIFMIA
ncbi:hypothetical protein RND81_08G083200 [Saponaria officinalis]|uniref:FLZ-type domain-containing protein n=1 Tax=Saponaria officinalis TaxID=3572 RepID=A0AAW1J4V4_SAPOF